MLPRNLLSLLLVMVFPSVAPAVDYPPDTTLIFRAMPVNVPMPGYLVPFTDPVFNTVVTRIADKTAMGSDKDILAHHYAKDQPWNADGSLIMLSGWPSAVLDGKTYAFIRWIWPQGEHHTWSNVDPDIIYGIQPPNTWVKLNARTGESVNVRSFSEYTQVSYGDYEGNMSNDDRFVALQCKTANENFVVVYDLPNDRIISRMSIGSDWPNNVAMSQSGEYVAVQWNVAGTGEHRGTEIYTRDLTYVRKVSTCGGCHYDLGYDTDGHEVAVAPDIDGATRAILSIRLDNGQETVLLKDSQMSWYVHISCRSVKRPGWAWLTEFADPNTQTAKPNYQLAFGVKIDGSGTVERFAHVHHSATVAYERAPFGVPNREGGKMMFRSDWEDGDGPIYSYVAEMPGETETGVGGEAERIPSEGYRIFPLFPNPFNASATIRYTVPRTGRVEVAVYDVLGRQVRLLENGVVSAGEHALIWNGNDASGKSAGSGIYFYRLRAGTVVRTGRMALLR